MTDPGPWLVVLPLLAGIAGFLATGSTARTIGLLVSAAMLPLCGALAVSVWRDGTWSYALGGFDAPLGIALRADGAAAAFAALTAVVGAAVSAYAAASFRPAPRADAVAARAPGFWPLWMLLWASLNALFFAGDVFNAYVGLELMTLASVALILLDRGRAALVAGLRYLLAAFFGSLMYLLGVAVLYAHTGTLDLALLAELDHDGLPSKVAAALMITGLLLKAALFPVHFWLPAAHASAPAPVSAALSALVVKAAFALVLTLWFRVFGGALAIGAGHLLGALGAIAIVLGSVQAIHQERLKLMIAYSTVAQVGYLFLVIPLAGGGGEDGWRPDAFAGALYHALSHGLAKASMFLAAGAIVYRFGHDRIRELTGAAKELPIVYLAFGVAGLSLIGLPPSGGFVGKWLLLHAAIDSGQYAYAAVLILGGLLTAGYVAVVLSWALTAAPDAIERPGEDVPRAMILAVFALAGASLLLGLRAAEIVQFVHIGAPWAEPVRAWGTP